MALQTPPEIPTLDILRSVRMVVNTIIATLITDTELTDNGFKLKTSAGDELQVDLSGIFLKRGESDDITNVPFASETQTGRIAISTAGMAQELLDDTTALTPAKLLIALTAMGLLKFDLNNQQEGDLLTLEASDDGFSVKNISFTQYINSRSNFDQVAKAGTLAERGKTDQKISLFGGLLLANLTAPPEGMTLKQLVLGSDSNVYAVDAILNPTDDGAVYLLGTQHYEFIDVVTPSDVYALGTQHYEFITVVANRPPVVTNPQPDKTYSTNGVYEIDLPVDEFTDPDGDPITLQPKIEENGSYAPLPAWIVYTAPRKLTVNITNDVANGDYHLRILGVDPLNQSNWDDFLITVARSVADPVISVVNWKWVRMTTNNPDASNRIYLYITTQNSPDSVKVEWSYNGSARQGFNATKNSGNSFSWDLNFPFNLPVTFYLTPYRSSQAFAEVSFSLTVPSGPSTSPVQLYPSI